MSCSALSFRTGTLTCLLLVLLFSSPVFAQAPSIQWQYSFGGSDKDYGIRISQTKDSGYISANHTNSNDDQVSGLHLGEDIWIAQISKTGSLQWQKCIGGDSIDQCNSIQQTYDGGYILAGWTNSAHGDISRRIGNGDYWVVKLDDTGKIVWEKSYGGSATDHAQAIFQTPDSNYVVAGYAYSEDSDVVGNHGSNDLWILKLDDTGGVIWKKCYGGTGNEGASAIRQTQDGNFIVIGSTTSTDGDVTLNHGSTDYWVLKLNDTGKILWQRTYGGSGDDYANDILQTNDGGYIAAGYTNSTDGDITGNLGVYDFWTLKLDDTGGVTWKKCYGGSYTDECFSVQQASDSGFIMTGMTTSFDGQITTAYGSGDIWVIKTNPSGNLLWEKTLGGSNVDASQCGIIAMDGGIVVSGSTRSIDHDVAISHGSSDIWILKLNVETSVSVLYSHTYAVRAYPNPASEMLTLELPENYQAAQIFFSDILGKEISIPISGLTEKVLNLQNVSPGVYLLQIASDNEVSRLKVVVSPK